MVVVVKETQPAVAGGTTAHHDPHHEAVKDHDDKDDKGMKAKAADKTADTAVKAGVKLEKARGKMGGKLDGVIDKAEQGLAKVHDKAVEKKE